jgi:ribosomal protein S18 acetylase RimI-like enzyme
VRNATPVDYDAVRDVTLRGYLGDGFGDEEYAQALADVEGRARHAEILVATLGENAVVVGAVALALWPSPVAEVGRENEAVFRMLAVAPEARRQGVGASLVRECLDRARRAGASALVLSSMPGMTAAHRLYERLGFQRLPERDWSPRSGVDLIVYGWVFSRD